MICHLYSPKTAWLNQNLKSTLLWAIFYGNFNVTDMSFTSKSCVCLFQNSMKVMFKCLWKNCEKSSALPQGSSATSAPSTWVSFTWDRCTRLFSTQKWDRPALFFKEKYTVNFQMEVSHIAFELRWIWRAQIVCQSLKMGQLRELFPFWAP